MNDSINCSGFVEMFVDSYDSNEPYGYRLTDKDVETTKDSIQLYAAGINDNDYGFSND